MVRPPEETAPTYYPVALVPGQFQEYYRTYNAAELLYVIYNSKQYNRLMNIHLILGATQ